MVLKTLLETKGLTLTSKYLQFFTGYDFLVALGVLQKINLSFSKGEQDLITVVTMNLKGNFDKTNKK